MRRDHINAPLPEILQGSRASAEDWPEAALPEEWVSRILERMRTLYGERFVRQWHDVDADTLRRRWGVELGRLAPDQLGRGLRALSTLDNPPTVPQFVNLCRLDPRAAYYEALACLRARERGAMGEWSDPAIYWAAAEIGAFDMKTQAYRRIRARWQAALAAAQAAPRAEPIPAPAASPSAAWQPRQAGKATNHPLFAASEFSSAPAGPRDPKRWAKRILARRAAGDTAVTAYQAWCAENALR